MKAPKFILKFSTGNKIENWYYIQGKLTKAKPVPNKDNIDAVFDVLAYFNPLLFGLMPKNIEYVIPKTAAKAKM